MQRKVRYVLAASLGLGLFACSGSSPGDVGDGTGDGSPTGTPSGLFGGRPTGGGGANAEGAPSATTRTCVRTGNAGCDACLNASCCDDLVACKDDVGCVAIFECAADCAAEACVRSCFERTPAGQSRFLRVASCVSGRCEGRC